ncbi:MFS transporter [Pilimelia anulata]|uniref:MFS transporter n=1 Tax=Pilimelia anulata TaxID=53371 RepID=A0A8J3BH49_9ACTN|nr:MFS transporter [Pilimelia anulata]GGK07555.1 MFS transporter [Pilimelia anulata]
MYLSTTRAADRPATARRAAGRVSGTVVGLGLVSLVTDLSAEMVTAILPLYLVYRLGVGYAALGAIDGLYTGGTAVLRIAGGYLADRLGRPRAVAAVGYGLSALTKLALPAAGGSVAGIGMAIAVDRAGKGIRTAPRDAMITAATPPDLLGRAFGVHRALDTAGALLGPLLAFALVAWTAGAGYDAVFGVSFCLGLVGLFVLLFLVPMPGRVAAPGPPPGPSAALAALRGAAPRRLIGGAALLGLCTVGDMFLYLAVQQRFALPTGVLPLLPLGTALTFMLAAAPVGRLADRVGRWRVFLAGHGLLVVAYLLLAGLPGWPVALLALGCHGLFYAATDGVLMAHAATLVPASVRATGLSAVQTAQAVARAGGALAFGLLAQYGGLRAAFVLFALALVGALAAAGGLGRARTAEAAR